MKRPIIERLFSTINIASAVIIVVFGVIYFAFLLTHAVYIDNIYTAIYTIDFIHLQATLETAFTNMITISGWIQVAIGMLLIVASAIFILNTARIIFSVFINKPFSAGGSATVNWIRFSVGKGYLTVKLFVFISLYKMSGMAGFEILQDFFPGNTVLNTNFFLASNIPFGTIVIVSSVAYVAVYEIKRFSDIIEEKWNRGTGHITVYNMRHEKNLKRLNEAYKSTDPGYKNAKIEDAVRDMNDDRKLLTLAEGELSQLASPRKMMQNLMLTCIGTIIIQIVTDMLGKIGWGTILDAIIRIFGL